jgi:hypothetical protein
MSDDVQFQNQWRAVKYYNEPATPKVVKWVTKLSGGLIKDENQASYVLIGLVVVAIIVSLFLFFGGGSGGESRENLFPPGSSALGK